MKSDVIPVGQPVGRDDAVPPRKWREHKYTRRELLDMLGMAPSQDFLSVRLEHDSVVVTTYDY